MTIIAVFAVIGGVDRIFGNRLGIGKEFEKCLLLMGPLFLSMSEMLVIAPVIAMLFTKKTQPEKETSQNV